MSHFPIPLGLIGGADRLPPTVSITNPPNGSNQSGVITVSASASDPVGVAGVQFKIDGTNLGAEDVVAPYQVSLDTHTLSAGSHTISATARDNLGNAATVSVTFNVTNSVPAGGAVVFGDYTQFDSGEGGYTTGRWLVRDESHHNGEDWRWSVAGRSAQSLPGNPDSTHYQMRTYLQTTGAAEGGTDGNQVIIALWINGSGPTTVWNNAIFTAGIMNINGGDLLWLERWATVDMYNSAFTNGVRMAYDFVLKPGYAS
jgi:hypothetical protein